MRTMLRQRNSERGMAMIVIMAILSLMVVYIAANVRSLNTLERELRLIERKQVHRLQQISERNAGSLPSGTNAVNSARTPAQRER